VSAGTVEVEPWMDLISKLLFCIANESERATWGVPRSIMEAATAVANKWEDLVVEGIIPDDLESVE
jgi:hypothetical protein